jgi:polyisoprenoid-binding protein YceI
MIRSRLFLACTVLIIALGISPSPVARADSSTDVSAMPAGTYQLDPNHASITFKINHLGFSHYTGRFDQMEATLNFNPAAPDQSALNVTIYPNSINTNNAKLEEELRGDKYFDVIKFPRATFQSTKIERTGSAAGKVTGDFTFLGVTHTLTLDVTLVGAGTRPMDSKKVIGFSATGTMKRSDWGLTNLLPLVGDDVALEIEAEFDKAE